MNRREIRKKRLLTRRRQKGLGILLIGTLIASLAGYQIWRNIPQVETLPGPDNLDLGMRVYIDTCASCHGTQGEGHLAIAEAPALNGNEHSWHHPDGQIQRVIQNGGQKMPPFGDQLTDAEITATIRYIQTWWSADQLASQQSRSLQDPIR